MGRHYIAAIGITLSLGCGSAVTPALVQCKLEALRVLPADPEQATVADARDLVSRIKACHAAPDAGQ